MSKKTPCREKGIGNDVRTIGNRSYSLYEKIKLVTDEYVLGLTAADDSVAASLSDTTVIISKLSNTSLTPSCPFKPHKNTVTGIKYDPEDRNTIFTSSKDGTIKAWDGRTLSSDSKPSQVFQDNSKEELKPINCFDVDSKGPFICGGTDQIEHDAFLLFWDRRKTSLLGGYWDSHTDDITNVRYHPEEKDIIVSGSVDGLINVFDVSQSSEDDALLNTINTESSVGKLSWECGNDLTCITHTEEMQIWDYNDVKLIRSYTRECFKKSFNIDTNYFIDTIKFPNHHESMVMTGDDGTAYVWLLQGDDTSLWTVLEKGHSDVVRCRTLIGDKIVTGGEDGLLCLWKEDILDPGKKLSVLKHTNARHKHKPY